MADGFTPPQSVRSAAKRGLELRQKHNRGGTAVGVARARDLSNGKSIPIETIRRMVSYFARHEVDKKGEGWGVDSAGYIAWLLWGGDAGRAWATKISNDYDKKEKSIMAQDLAYSFAGITKSEKQEDGTLKVYGKATDDSIDIDSQICDPTWLASAMPQWFKSGGNIREQHSNIAAGVATEYEAKGAEHFIEALVVDPVSVKKVETGVLKGFSIGIRSPRVVRDNKAANGRIIDGQIVEVSLVDRPANPNAKLMLAKAAESGELMAVDQIPTPAELFAKKNAEAETPAEEVAVEAVADEVATEEVAAEPVAEEVVADVTPEDEAEKAANILNLSKSFLAELNKFDQATFDKAREALADLIVVEANEMKEGHDERDSIKELLRSVKHLLHWYEGEVEEGEVEGVVAEDVLPVIEMSASTEDVKMCDKCDMEEKDCKCDMSAEAEKSLAIDPAQVDAIMEKAVASAKASVSEEIELLKAAVKAEEQKSMDLEAKLADALTKAVAGGPSRVAKSAGDKTKVNEMLAKAASYSAKAASTTDQILAKGYRELAEDLRAKAEKIEKEN